MMEVLGNESKSTYRYKFPFLVFILFSYLFIYFMYIGASPSEQATIIFYSLFGFFLGVLPLLVDLFFQFGIDAPLDTISYEANSFIPILNRPRVNLFLSLILGFLVILKIKFTHQAFIKAPQFALSLGLFSFHLDKIANGILSGLVGGVFESLVFFGFLFPTIYATFRKRGFNPMIALLLSIVIVSLIFTGYHYWRYGYIASALLGVFIFGVIQCVLVYLFRSLLPAITTHFANNFAVYLFQVAGYSIKVVF